jgi:hypothetical protein
VNAAVERSVEVARADCSHQQRGGSCSTLEQPLAVQ